MRNHVIDELTKLAEKDNRIMLLSADLGFNVLNKFEDKFPDRYVNVGIAEQNMASIAAGLAIEGNKVFMYSIGNFPTLRCIEQIRNDICYHNADVKILAVGGGFAYGDLGMSHHATEDIAMMRALPNMRVYVPADEIEAVKCLYDAYLYKSPAYIRMARGKEKCYHTNDNVNIISPIHINDHLGDICILSTGTILSEAIKLNGLLKDNKIDSSVLSVPLIKPIDSSFVRKLALSSKMIVTLEEHNIMAGFGSIIAEVLSEIQEKHAFVMRFGLQDEFTSVVGDQDYLRDYYKLSADTIYPIILKKIRCIK